VSKQRNWRPIRDEFGRILGIIEKVSPTSWHVSIDGIHCGVVGSPQAGTELLKRVRLEREDGGNESPPYDFFS
jgi:hypothetical protein